MMMVKTAEEMETVPVMVMVASRQRRPFCCLFGVVVCWCQRFRGRSPRVGEINQRHSQLYQPDSLQSMVWLLMRWTMWHGRNKWSEYWWLVWNFSLNDSIHRPGAPFECSSNNTIYRFQETILENASEYISCSVRWPRGRDIMAAWWVMWICDVGCAACIVDSWFDSCFGSLFLKWPVGCTQQSKYGIYRTKSRFVHWRRDTEHVM